MRQRNNFFQKNTLCHSFRIIVIPSVLKVFDSQGYLWLPYDLTEVIKLIGERFEPKKYFFSKKYPMSFLPHYCHSFRITVIPSGFLSFLPDYCHSFQIIVIPSDIDIPSELLPFQIFVILNSSSTLPYPKARKMASELY